MIPPPILIHPPSTCEERDELFIVRLQLPADTCIPRTAIIVSPCVLHQNILERLTVPLSLTRPWSEQHTEMFCDGWLDGMQHPPPMPLASEKQCRTESVGDEVETHRRDLNDRGQVLRVIVAQARLINNTVLLVPGVVAPVRVKAVIRRKPVEL
jgi:hypothetical protein